MTFEQALLRASDICARQEKCVFDIEKKLNSWKVEEPVAAKVIDQLIKEKFIDEQRYVNHYVRDKFRFNRWGKIKIRYQLKAKCISGQQVNEALQQISEDEYKDALAQLLNKKRRNLKEDDKYKKRASLIRYAASRGFEPDLIYQLIDSE
ncbi:regulatory protein [Saccharicrinis carchari]|uniref:Regulatory protein RecX n=1 Tax=Saccharicrinis carchari TaxID=1168039 RepID=A0A521DII5_SACCC|nr:regulatory protein RecX [Saccharicrinis carchari]SMO71519.1 regulatory protein [Saccharicrinis carchari]